MTNSTEEPFVSFPKLYRLNGPVVITEKLDGTNAQLLITESGDLIAGSRTRWLTPESDNHGFAKWAYANKTDLKELLGIGRHFGEWVGSGINRGYNLKEKRFYLFNTTRWNNPELRAILKTINVYVVPVMYTGVFDTVIFDNAMLDLKTHGSFAFPGYMNPEGIVIYDTRSGVGFKRTFNYDDTGKNVARDIDHNPIGAV